MGGIQTSLLSLTAIIDTIQGSLEDQRDRQGRIDYYREQADAARNNPILYRQMKMKLVDEKEALANAQADFAIELKKAQSLVSNLYTLLAA